jgi:hypothetical protein
MKAKEQLDDYKGNLKSILEGTTDYSINNPDLTQPASRLNEAPAK